ncbi:MAG: ATP-grasp domain-containing protein [Bryobacteraceae bacterium]
MKSLTVLVTAVGGGAVGEQILKALRRGSAKYIVVGTDMSPDSKGLMEVDYPAIVPPATHPGYIAALLELCAKHGAKCVLCGSEPELRVLSAHRDEFARNGIFLPVNPSSVLDICLDKIKTAAFLREHGFAVPAFRRISSPQDALDFPALPAVIKPSVGGSGSANTFLAQTSPELRFYCEHLLSLYPECVIQEYVGTPHAEFTVGVLSDMAGQLLNSIAVRRNILSTLGCRLKQPNRSSRSDLGPLLAISSGYSQGQIGRFPEVTSQCEQIAMTLGARGPLNIQCRLVGGVVFVFEINPRFSGTTSLRAMVGYNEPDVLIRRHLLGETIQDHFPYESGLILRGLSEVLMDPARLPSEPD